MERFYVFVNGIETDSNDLEAWHFRAERYVETNLDSPADTYHYTTRALTRWLDQGKIVKGMTQFIKEILSGPKQFKLVLVGHSNGCKVICDFLAANPDIKVAYVHLIAGAVEASFETNKLNAAIWSGQVDKVFVYWDPQDPALKVARATYWIPFLRYGDLGLIGPKNVDSFPEFTVIDFKLDGYGHSNYFVGDKFDEIMRSITRPASTGE